MNLKGRLKTSGDWKKYINGEISGLPELPGNLWRNPNVHFINRGDWKGWDDLLGLKKSQNKKSCKIS